MENEPLVERPRRHLGLGSSIFLNVNRIVGTGIFSIPGGVYALVGSVGGSLLLWILGAIMVLCGFSVYFEFGLEMPHSGGEMNYLARSFKRPRHLAMMTFAFSLFLLQFSASNSYAFGLYWQLVTGASHPSDQVSRYIACFLIVAIALLHGIFPKLGTTAFNVLGVFKLLILLFIATCGVLVMCGLWKLENPPDNFHNWFEHDGHGGGLYDLATALLRVSYSYRGWETCFSVMGEIKHPYRTMKIAGPVSIFIIVVLYLLCNIAYFSVIPKAEIRDAGAIIAGKFFEKLFGTTTTAKILPLFVCLSNLGNILVVCYACGRVINEFGRHYIIPFSGFFGSMKPFGTPFAGLMWHAVLTVLVVLLPPKGEVYEFVVDLSTYPITIFATAITVGLVLLHKNHEKEQWGIGKFKWHTPMYAIAIFFFANMFMIIFPWVPPSDPDTSKLPYYAYPLGSVCVILCSIIYWYFWSKTENHKLYDREVRRKEDYQITW